MSILDRVDKTFALGDNEGDSRTAENYYIVLHESGNQSDVNASDPARNEAQFMKSNWNGQKTGAAAYATYFVGSGGKIFQIGEPGYVAWAALNANPYAPIQIELARTNDPETFNKDYATYVELARYWAQKLGIPLTLDAGGQGTKGIKTHQWVTNNYGGDHVDPLTYFAAWGVTKDKLAHDLANGLGIEERGIDEVNYDDFNQPRSRKILGVAYVTKSDGATLYSEANPWDKTGRVLPVGSAWQISSEHGNYWQIGGYVSKNDVVVKTNTGIQTGNWVGMTISMNVDTNTFDKPDEDKLAITKKGESWLVIGQNKDASWFQIGSNVWVPATNCDVIL
ncbi:peptidoglycan recognition family protein [Agrilactobacillus fermenti]|uniref:peptidoglycan recognition protein family protein n=1 Tax=Agrilactobacillus fermenti TaxID=2586909 RepID=UPI001E2DA71C|nr:peptidoglycan recognition family protein [Agrilactobacillus fermenti]MCD2256399.1 N-acetylmuramoyl-L-alanine amidase [Agrilactobacillus fermenti]